MVVFATFRVLPEGRSDGSAAGLPFTSPNGGMVMYDRDRRRSIKRATTPSAEGVRHRSDPCPSGRMPVGDQVAVRAQYGLRADQQPDGVQHVAVQPVQQRGEKHAVQVPFEDGDLVPEREDFAVLVAVIDRQTSSVIKVATTRAELARDST